MHRGRANRTREIHQVAVPGGRFRWRQHVAAADRRVLPKRGSDGRGDLVHADPVGESVAARAEVAQPALDEQAAHTRRPRLRSRPMDQSGTQHHARQAALGGRLNSPFARYLGSPIGIQFIGKGCRIVEGSFLRAVDGNRRELDKSTDLPCFRRVEEGIRCRLHGGRPAHDEIDHRVDSLHRPTDGLAVGGIQQPRLDGRRECRRPPEAGDRCKIARGGELRHDLLAHEAAGAHHKNLHAARSAGMPSRAPRCSASRSDIARIVRVGLAWLEVGKTDEPAT